MKSVLKPILPGSTIGVLGSGQLGRMFAIEARKLGYRVHTFSPDTDSPTGQISDEEYVGDYLDLDRLREFARGVDVITFEFENVPFETTEAAEQIVPVRPRGEILYTTQHRLREKTFLSKVGIPIGEYVRVDNLQSLENGIERIGYPAILKTAGFGYDGKGQRKINSPSDLDSLILDTEYILEKFIPFEKEISVVAARGMDGDFQHFGVIENIHKNHILHISIAPARITDTIRKQAIEISRTVLEKLGVVGVLCVEMFVTQNESILVNELAPRPHNSGHYTFDANVTSQFEQQVRAVCGLPLGSTDQMRPAVMLNLLGDLWSSGAPDWQKVLRHPNAKLHLYGKQEAKPGRKMGHITVLGNTIQDALETAKELEKLLVG